MVKLAKTKKVVEGCELYTCSSEHARIALYKGQLIGEQSEPLSCHVKLRLRYIIFVYL